MGEWGVGEWEGGRIGNWERRMGDDMRGGDGRMGKWEERMGEDMRGGYRSMGGAWENRRRGWWRI